HLVPNPRAAHRSPPGPPRPRLFRPAPLPRADDPARTHRRRLGRRILFPRRALAHRHPALRIGPRYGRSLGMAFGLAHRQPPRSRHALRRFGTPDRTLGLPEVLPRPLSERFPALQA